MSLPAMKKDRMAVFSHLLVALADDCRSGDQNAKLTVSQPRDQARNFANAYGSGRSRRDRRWSMRIVKS